MTHEVSVFEKLAITASARITIDVTGKGVWRRIQDARPKRDPIPRTPLVHHYTSLEVLANILNQSISDGGPIQTEIWATSARHMNDLEEVRIGEDRLTEIAELASEARIKELLDRLIPFHEEAEAYCACFSGSDDDLAQWRGYGDGGRGVQISYRRQELEDRFPGVAGWVIYREESQLLVAQRLAESLVRAVTANGAEATSDEQRLLEVDLPHLVGSLLPFFKSAAFKSEQEFRLVHRDWPGTKRLPVFSRGKSGRLSPFVKLPFPDGAPLTRITVGPSTDSRTEDAIKLILRKAHLDGKIEVKRSSIPYVP
jgi:hypothetical protein